MRWTGPWWPRTQYPWYLPVYDTQAYLKVGYRGFESDVDVTEATSVLLNISLVLESQ